jgi:glycosyltransferase involved in cell wall biosynthesis
MLKILFYSPMSLRDGAGFQEWLERTLTSLSNTAEKTVVYGSLGDRLRWSAEEVNKRFSPLTGLRPVSYRIIFGSWCLPSPVGLFQLYKLFRRQDVIYINHSFRLHDPIPKLLAKIAGKRIILGFHSPYHKTFGRLAYLRLFSVLFLRFVDACHVLNSTSKKFLEQAGAKRVFLIPNFLLKKQLPGQNQADFRGDYVIVGRNERQKGLDLLAPALRKILEAKPELKFHFYGTGSTKPIVTRLEKRFPRNVFNHGYEIDKDKIYSGKKYLVLTSREEPFGLVIIEAMAYGLPVVVSKTAGPQDIVKENAEGWFVSELTSSGIELAILRTLAISREEYKVLSSRAYKKARRYYTEDNFLPAFKKMLAAALSTAN